MKWFSRLLLLLTGWKITGNYRNDIKKKIIIMAPHTSSWDLGVGLMCRPLMNDQIYFVAKKEAFEPRWVGVVLRWLGGIPVNRSKSTNFVRAVVNEFEKRDRLTIVLTPEGTRKKVTKLKSGFYYMARKGDLPIIMCAVDYPTKIVHFSDPVYLSEHMEAELKKIERYFRPYTGLHPEKSFN